MATKKAANGKKSTAKSNRGGSRAGAGRKPKAITEMREALITPMLAITNPPSVSVNETCVAPLSANKTAAQYALDLFEQTMKDQDRDLELRLDCAREVLNRTIGKPRLAAEPVKEDGATEQVHIYMPDNGRDVAACG